MLYKKEDANSIYGCRSFDWIWYGGGQFTNFQILWWDTDIYENLFVQLERISLLKKENDAIRNVYVTNVLNYLCQSILTDVLTEFDIIKCI